MTLTELIAAHPEWDGMTDAQVADAINAKTLTREDEAVLLDDMEIMRQLGTVPGHQLLEKIETRANVVDTTGKILMLRILPHLSPPGLGLDINHPATRQLLALLVSGSAITQAEADALIALGTRPASLADINGLDRVTHAAVAAARGA